MTNIGALKIWVILSSKAGFRSEINLENTFEDSVSDELKPPSKYLNDQDGLEKLFSWVIFEAAFPKNWGPSHEHCWKELK